MLNGESGTENTNTTESTGEGAGTNETTVSEDVRLEREAIALLAAEDEAEEGDDKPADAKPARQAKAKPSKAAPQAAAKPAEPKTKTQAKPDESDDTEDGTDENDEPQGKKLPSFADLEREVAQRRAQRQGKPQQQSQAPQPHAQQQEPATPQQPAQPVTQQQAQAAIASIPLDEFQRDPPGALIKRGLNPREILAALTKASLNPQAYQAQLDQAQKQQQPEQKPVDVEKLVEERVEQKLRAWQEQQQQAQQQAATVAKYEKQFAELSSTQNYLYLSQLDEAERIAYGNQVANYYQELGQRITFEEIAQTIDDHLRERYERFSKALGSRGSEQDDQSQRDGETPKKARKGPKTLSQSLPASSPKPKPLETDEDRIAEAIRLLDED